MSTAPRKPLLVNLAWLLALSLLLAVGYVLSYAPVVRFSTSQEDVFAHPIAAYQPVDWLIDHTPLQTPLLKWAELWGVETDFVWQMLIRTRDRRRRNG